MSSDFDVSKGRYWQVGVELVSGCTPCSPGCDHCWSAALAHRFKRDKMNSFDLNPTQYTNERGAFDGRVVIHPERLKRFSTRQPKVFAIWNDLYHEAVPDDFIDDVIASIVLSPRHKFLVLTKRPQRMMDYFLSEDRYDYIKESEIYRHANYQTDCDDGDQSDKELYLLSQYEDGMNSFRRDQPIINIWHGLTICNQQEADEKIPIFLQVPGKKFLSIEPCISPIDLRFCQWCGAFPVTHNHDCYDDCQPIDAVILGGETGPGARPLNPDWVRSVRDQCAAGGVPFYFKSWGKHLPEFKECFGNEVVFLYPEMLIDIKRLLDGRTHDELPWSKS